MAQVQLVVGGRHYRVACQDGGETHLERLAHDLDLKIAEVTRSMGGMDEPRQLLFAALLLADELVDLRRSIEELPPPVPPAPAPPPPAIDPAALRALERLADRVEALAGGLEPKAPAS